MPDTAPNQRTLETTVPAQATAATVQDQVIGDAPFAGTVSEATLIPEANVTGNATNYRTFRVINKGQTGVGSTVIATFATDAPTTKDLVAFDEKTLGLSGTPANLQVANDDVLAVDEIVAGTGVAHAGYRIKVTIDRG